MNLAESGFIRPQELAYVGKKGGSYLLTFSFSLSHWDQRYLELSWDYWSSRYFELKSTPQGGMYGRRGSVQGNLFSADIRKVMGEILLEHSQGMVTSQVRLDFRYQIMTEWDLLDYKLEHLLYRRALLGLPKPDFISNLDRARFVGQIKWMLWSSLDRFPEEYTDGILELTDHGLPTIEALKQ